MPNWQIRETTADVRLMSVTLGVSETMAAALAHRGIRSKKAAIKYLNPKMEFLGDWREFAGMEKAAGIIMDAVKRGQKITVYGDYDVDGVMGAVILYKAIGVYGGDGSYYIPHREEEGYGLNREAVMKLKEAETELLITCDNGISALMETALAKSSDMRVIIIDHHEPGFVEGAEGRKSVIPDADAVIDPKADGCPYRFKELCAAALAYRLAQALFELGGREYEYDGEFLALAAIATVCDIVPMLDENRIIVKNGLARLNGDKDLNFGLRRLLFARNLSEKELTVFDVGFIIGPCINACGRLEHAGDAVRLLLTEDDGEASRLALKMVELNNERKDMTAESAERIMESGDLGRDKVVVVYDGKTHESVAGIVAGRIKDAMCRPVIVLTDSASGVKGSARSVEGYNIFEELYRLKRLFTRFGGHAMAAGLSMERGNVDALREGLNLNCGLTEEDFIPVMMLDAPMELNMVTYELARELAGLAPYGKDNPEPTFAAINVKPVELRMIDEKNTMIFSFAAEGYRKIRGVCFGMNDRWKQEICKVADGYEAAKIFAGVLRTADFGMDMVYSPEINEYNGNASVQVRIKDFKIYGR